jgi:hypothetical protein
MPKNLVTTLLAVVLLAACAVPNARLLPLESTLGHPLEVTLYHVPT